MFLKCCSFKIGESESELNWNAQFLLMKELNELHDKIYIILIPVLKCNLKLPIF